MSCKRLIRVRNEITGSFSTCEAFPDGIPSIYITGGQPHTTPDPQGRDHGLLYQRDPAEDLFYENYVEAHPDFKP